MGKYYLHTQVPLHQAKQVRQKYYKIFELSYHDHPRQPVLILAEVISQNTGRHTKIIKQYIYLQIILIYNSN